DRTRQAAGPACTCPERHRSGDRWRQSGTSRTPARCATRAGRAQNRAMARPHSPGVSGGGIERLRVVADSLPVMIRHSTPDRLATYFNKPWLDFTGRTLEQESGSGWSENVHPEDLERCLTTAERAFDTQERFEMQYRLRRSDGQYRWVVDR